MIKIAVVGAGRMARVRTNAFLASSKKCAICCVASKRIENAQALAREIGCHRFTDDYREILADRPDAVLIEVPHAAQDKSAPWALKSRLNVLIGGCLATNVTVGLQITRLADRNRLVIETGYEARYKQVWNVAKRYLKSGRVGEIIAVRSVALFNADPISWYYDEQQSGGMILTHMTYAFINPIRWIIGEPLKVSAFSNSRCERALDKVKHETCTANFLFKNDIIGNMTAGYVKPPGLDAWNILFLGARGSLEIRPGDLEPGSLTLYTKEGSVVSRSFATNNAFTRQAEAFLGSIANEDHGLNNAWDSLIDVRIAETVAESANRQATLRFDLPLRPRLRTDETPDSEFLPDLDEELPPCD